MHMSPLLNRQLKLIDSTKGIEKAKYQYELGLWYEQGTHALSKRPDLAIVWYKRAAKNGHRDAMYALATAYANGRHGLEKRLDLALRWFETASKNGSIEAQSRLPNAHYELAMAYQHGTCGVEKDLERALYYYKLASGKGLSEASYNLGLIYKKQAQHIQDALYYFKIASFQGDIDAAIEIEHIYKENPALRPEPPKPALKPSSLPPGFNRQRRVPSQSISDMHINVHLLLGQTKPPVQIAEPQPFAEAAVLTPGFNHHQQSTRDNGTPDKMHELKMHLDPNTNPQKENKRENPPLTRGKKLPPIPVFSNALPTTVKF